MNVHSDVLKISASIVQGAEARFHRYDWNAVDTLPQLRRGQLDASAGDRAAQRAGDPDHAENGGRNPGNSPLGHSCSPFPHVCRTRAR